VKCPHAHDDGAYVLGALSPAERSAFEKHLATCAECRDAVAEVAVLPGLLGRLPADRVDPGAGPGVGLVGPAAGPVGPGAVGPGSESGVGPAGAPVVWGPAGPDSRVPALLDAARERRRREQTSRRRRYAAGGVAAAVLAVLVGVGVVVARPDGGGVPDGGGDGGPVTPPVAGPTTTTVRMVAMSPVAGKVPVSAEVGLNGASWGTEVTMHCTYPEANYTRAYTFRLVAHGADGSTEQVSSWMAGPGDDITVTGATRFSGTDLVRLEITSYNGTPLLAYDVP
jgi:hypothetical protein